jgi:serine/threonine-protein kinase
MRLTTDLIVGRLVLPSDVDLSPASQLDRALRRRINARSSDYTLSRPGTRAGAKVIDSDTASLLLQFRSPTTIAEAIVNRVRDTGEAPRAVLEAVHPVLVNLIRSQLLVSATDADGDGIEARHAPGDVVARCVIRSVMHVMSDTELYVAHPAGNPDVTGVLKLGRVSPSESMASIAHEAGVLRHLGGGVAPALIDAGQVGGFDYALMEWRRGVDAARAAAGIRASGARTARAPLARLAADIADAYAQLHARGIIHGDVHERNVLVDRDGAVTILDFGLARFADGRATPSVRRGGHPFYYEPEFARASIDDGPFPDATAASDQYALGAILYHLITGSTYIDFDLDEPRAFAKIATAPMVPFERRGLAPWPAMEAVLARALTKNQAGRFPTIREFAIALQRAGATEQRNEAMRARRGGTNRRARVAARMLDRLSRPDAPLEMRHTPTASIAFGAAGIGIAFYRLALLRDDAGLLSVAARWSLAARAERRRARALYDGGELTPGTFGHRAFYYGTSGLDVAEALIAAAMGDFMTLRGATRRLAGLPERAGDALDCILGVPGTLIGLSHLLDAMPEHDLVDRSIVTRAGEGCARVVAQALARRGAIADQRRFANLGIAHGWAGALFSLMRWHSSSGAPLPAWVGSRLDELAAMAEPTDRGLRWPWRDARPDARAPSYYMPGWCNGSAGFVHLWTSAYAMFGDARYLELAEGAAWDAYDDSEDSVYDLCCGRGGRAYALLAMHRASGGDAWLVRAQQLADEALDLIVKASDPPPGLIKGTAGVLLLNAELEQPHKARLPVFESEGWPTTREESAR